jgi:hypothetical protein
MENEIKGDEKKVRPHPTLHHIYQAVLLKFDSIVVAVMLEYVLGYIRPLSILLQSMSCDLMKAHQEARDFALFFQGI